MSKTLSFVMLMRSKATLELLKCRNAFVQLGQIAYRARRTNEFLVDDLDIGEALIGDFKSIGLTRQEYRTALKKLVKWGFITIRATNNGTVAKLINSEVFDINAEIDNHHTNQLPTNEKPPSGHPVTTNKKLKNENNEKKEKKGPLPASPPAGEADRELYKSIRDDPIMFIRNVCVLKHKWSDKKDRAQAVRFLSQLDTKNVEMLSKLLSTEDSRERLNSLMIEAENERREQGNGD
jgi:hypothetical protein